MLSAQSGTDPPSPALPQGQQTERIETEEQALNQLVGCSEVQIADINQALAGALR